MKINGFTLIELVIVIVLLVILAATARHFYPGKTIDLRAKTEQLAHDIRYIQELAMSRNERFRIDLSQATSYRFLDSSGASLPHPASNESNINFGSGITMAVQNSNKYLIFDGRGAPYLNDSATGDGVPLTNSLLITLKSGKDSFNIIIQPITGYLTTS